MFLTGKQMGEVFLKAKRERFGIIASNVVFDTQIRAIIQGYNAVGSDGLMQMSSGAVKYAAGASQDMKAGARLISTMIRTFADQFPKSGIGLHVDHATPNYFDFLVYCIENKLVTSVMIDASKEALAENIRVTKEVVDVAHKHGIIVEGEIGHIKGTEDEIVSETELYTHPEEALEFVKKTNVDLFAASVGTNHGVSKGENIVLRLDLIKEIDDLLIANGVERGLVDEESIEAAKLLGRQRGDESFRRFSSGASAPGQPGAFDRVGSGKNDFSGPQTIHNRACDRRPLVGGPCGRGGEIEGDWQICADEGTQAEVAGNFAGMVEPGLDATAVVEKNGRR